MQRDMAERERSSIAPGIFIPPLEVSHHIKEPVAADVTRTLGSPSCPSLMTGLSFVLLRIAEAQAVFNYCFLRIAWASM